MAQGLIGDGSQEKPNTQNPRDPSESDNFAAYDARIRERARNLPPLPFRAVNRFGTPGFEPGLQRHHILPLQLLAKESLARMLDAVGFRRKRFDDFRTNGLLLPANKSAAILMGLPLHRGPHKAYNDLVIERVGQIETGWSRHRSVSAGDAAIAAFYRLELLQNALRRRLLDPRGRPFALNRSDPAHKQPDFFEIDAMIDTLWVASSARLKEPESAVCGLVAGQHPPISQSARIGKSPARARARQPEPDRQLSFPGFAAEFPLAQKPVASGFRPFD